MKAAMTKAARRPAAPSSGGSLSWLQGLLCGGLFAVAPGTMALIVVLIGPGLAMVILETDRTRPVGRAMLLFGAAAAVKPVRSAILDGASGTVFGLCQPSDLALAWAGAGAGWLLAQLVPLFAAFIADALLAAERVRLTSEADKLRADWVEAAH